MNRYNCTGAYEYNKNGAWCKAAEVQRELERNLGTIQEQAAEIIHLTVRVQDADAWASELRQHGDNQMMELNMLREKIRNLEDNQMMELNMLREKIRNLEKLLDQEREHHSRTCWELEFERNYRDEQGNCI